jgi:hypothetical protein
LHILSPSRIRELGEDPSRCAHAVELEPIDFSRPFIPEEFTQLYFTPLYTELTHEQRLRYNQLFGVKVNEQVAVFEEDFTDRLLRRLVSYPTVAAQSDLQVCLERMIDEERWHSRMFHDLNRRCLPEVYGDRDRHFLRMGWPDRVGFALLTSAPYRLTFLLWFTTSMEEYSVGLSRVFIRNRETETLGPLEQNFVRVHAEHAKDETRHVHTVLNLIDTCQAEGWKVKRRINAALFRQLIRNIVVPRRWGAAVIRHLLQDCPELKPMGDRMIRAVRDLKDDERFQKSLFNRTLMPYTFQHLDAQPEFERLGEVMLGYDRRKVVR